MRERTIASVFQLSNRFVRSVHLERDFRDPSALEGYVLVPSAQAALARVFAGLQPTSGQRAWRITGDYGAGKSLFGLALARVLEGGDRVPTELSNALSTTGLEHSPRMFPLLITGAREGLAAAIKRAVVTAVDELCSPGKPHAALSGLKKRLANTSLADDAVLDALIALKDHLVTSRRNTGVLLVIDEMGKLLEFAALHPERSDVYLLQQLAEAATRSGERALVVVGMLHQGFRAYAETLSAVAQQEWIKVSSRFEEILFDQPLDQIPTLIARALNVSHQSLGKQIASAAASEARRALALGWYGAAAERTKPELAASMYPLHPSVVPVAVRFLRRFGQNERSLFGLLLADEPFGLQAFATRVLGADVWYRLPDLYDYVRANWGYALGGRSYQAQWLRIVEIVDGANDLPDLQRAVLKAVGLLNLLDADDLRATPESIAVAVSSNTSQVTQALDALRARRLLFDRGSAGGLCLWPHTSLDLEAARSAAERTLGPLTRVAPLLLTQLDATPIVARRHYVERGTLRHFEVRFACTAEASKALLAPATGDGLIFVLLSDTSSEHQAALEFAKSAAVATHTKVLVAVPEPVSSLGGLVQEVRCWEWVLHHTPELNQDRYAAVEVVRQLEAARRALAERAGQLVNLTGSESGLGLKWFYRGEPQEIRNGRQLVGRLSSLCDEIYTKAPWVTNELLNRRTLSSAAARARMALIGAVLEQASEPALGLPSEKAPPERAVYLSVLRQGNVHRKVGRGYIIAEPPQEQDLLHLRPSLLRLEEVLTEAANKQIGIEPLLDALRREPFGVRDGLIPLLLAIYVKAHEHELAFYEDGALLPKLGASDFLRLVKAPASFTIQLCTVAGVRAEVFQQLVALLDVPPSDGRAPVILDVVKPLCQFVAQLPPYTAKTNRLAAHPRGVRDALTRAQEPGPLLFAELPSACGVPPFESAGPVDNERVSAFVRELRAALDVLQGTYPALLERITSTLADSLGSPRPLAELRADVAKRAALVLLTAREARLKGFCLRLADGNLPPDRWIESIASFVREKPPARWVDVDDDAFAEATTALADTFCRVEKMVFPEGAAKNDSTHRVLVTRADGEEREEIIRITAEEEKEVAELTKRVTQMLTKGGTRGRVSMAAMTRAFWQVLGESTAATGNTPQTNGMSDRNVEGDAP